MPYVLYNAALDIFHVDVKRSNSTPGTDGAELGRNLITSVMHSWYGTALEIAKNPNTILTSPQTKQMQGYRNRALYGDSFLPLHALAHSTGYRDTFLTGWLRQRTGKPNQWETQYRELVRVVLSRLSLEQALLQTGKNFSAADIATRRENTAFLDEYTRHFAHRGTSFG